MIEQIPAERISSTQLYFGTKVSRYRAQTLQVTKHNMFPEKFIVNIPYHLRIKPHY